MSGELSKFQERCHHYFTCFTFAAKGLQSVADKFRPGLVEGKNQSLFIGSGHPDEGKAHSKVKLKDAVLSSAKDGVFSDTIAKSIIVTIYSEWEEMYRHKIAEEAGAEAKNIISDLMGDLRIVRNWIVHNKSVVDKDRAKIKVLSWQLQEGHELKVTSEMFSSLIDNINAMTVAAHAV
jgi:hypothetical protein